MVSQSISCLRRQLDKITQTGTTACCQKKGGLLSTLQALGKRIYSLRAAGISAGPHQNQQDLTRRPCGSQSHGEGGSSGKVQTSTFQHTCPHKHTNAPKAWEIVRVGSKLSWEICGFEHSFTAFLCVISTSCIMDMDF